MAVTSPLAPARPPEAVAAAATGTLDAPLHPSKASQFERTETETTKVDGDDDDVDEQQDDQVDEKGTGKKSRWHQQQPSLADRLRAKLFGKSVALPHTHSKKVPASSAAVVSVAPATSEVAAAPATVVSGPTTPAQAQADWADAQGPFEGPEKLLELWFADSAEDLVGAAGDSLVEQGKLGLKSVEQQVWEEMLDIVKCKVLSVIKSEEVDAYLLSESSMFVFPHKIILKTCGTTTLLLGLERLLQVARSALANYALPHLSTSPVVSSPNANPNAALASQVLRCFYSRKSFMFPERQKGPHKDWMTEVSTLDSFFAPHGSAYTVGKMNGDHWLLYMAAPGQGQGQGLALPEAAQGGTQAQAQSQAPLLVQDQTLEILMTSLSPASCARYYFEDELKAADEGTADAGAADGSSSSDKGHKLGLDLAAKLGLTDLFERTQIDAFAFEPCGFSANAVVLNNPAADTSAAVEGQQQGKMDGYWTIHVTPEEGSSYASFETNVTPRGSGGSNASAQPAATTAATDGTNPTRPQDLAALINRVVSTFEPGKMSITLFVSSSSSSEPESASDSAAANTESQESAAWQGNASVLHKLQVKGYRRTDRIAYEFEGYDLVFVSFEKLE